MLLTLARFCHVGVVYEGAFYIFGGYDGSSRLNDFLMYRFDSHSESLAPTLVSLFPSPALLSYFCDDCVCELWQVSDLRKLVNNKILSDVTFMVEGNPVFAHRVLLYSNDASQLFLFDVCFVGFMPSLSVLFQYAYW